MSVNATIGINGQGFAPAGMTYPKGGNSRGEIRVAGKNSRGEIMVATRGRVAISPFLPAPLAGDESARLQAAARGPARAWQKRGNIVVGKNSRGEKIVATRGRVAIIPRD